MYVFISFHHAIQGDSPSNNVVEWKRKFTMLLRDKEKQELISREKKDRHDFEQISALASRMGLYRYLLLHQNRCFIRKFVKNKTIEKQNYLWQPTVFKSCCL